MPGFLYLLSWVSTIVHICLGTLALAAALYYLAELVEEYTSTVAKVIRYWIWVTIGLYILLFLFESLPSSIILCGLVSQLVHLSILRTFPFFFLTSLPFIIGIGLFFINHYLAFSYFSSFYYPASEVLAYFTMCVWLVPFMFFISLSANENVLPTRAESRPFLSNEDDFVTGYFNKKGKKYGLLSFFNYLKEEFFPQRGKKAF
ncbi:protein TEX261-like [Portunus trituberculatus]|uniref:protein TEX261-like n=1 Tax=Portunus trituberculatus TaxID=210409 RepID=UPI001E1CF959|nr:protein TEX261-like [Portunus trituberculatus]